ncbi:MAG: hypothetical protein GX316_06485 [Firmicutes bacterium]|nr:hypothetical protein [Bacillota bacterium]
MAKKDALFMGIDGGQSGTRCVIINSLGEVVGVGQGDGIDFVLAPGGKTALAKALSSAVEGALSHTPRKFCAAFLGLSGVTPDGLQVETVKNVCQDIFESERLDIASDSTAAWAGALACKPGIVLISGSGSIALGVNHNDETARAGGWGYIFGDEGSGFGIAKDALKMTLHSLDVNQPLESFKSAFQAEFPHIPIESLTKAFYAGNITRAQFALVTKRLAGHAARGNRAAIELFRSSARMLACKVVGTAHKLTWPSDVITWSPVGGVFNCGSVILAPLEEYLKQLDRTYRYEMHPPLLPPAAGAALLAAKKYLQLKELDSGLSRRVKAGLENKVV